MIFSFHAMKPLTLAVSVLLIASATAEVVELGSSNPVVGHRRYGSIFSFGDSFADTDNDNVVVLAAHSLDNPSSPEELGLPFVPPFLAHNGSFRQGANFAVSGATALNGSSFSDNPIVVRLVVNISSSKQLEWFDSLKPSLCSRPGKGHGVLPV
ncbi:hypothetical protein BAE44_0023418 [Dichanthelium oligosanthes]|uniref:GDSL esterase/lipase n=1 Tax=Dichanthelium oligosanthes TaxID=888268 RepID=A0A1E5URR1_9POAL|nr:hypothetical protein BAE44_0023418 [Dichanthelium oligosanthes]